MVCSIDNELRKKQYTYQMAVKHFENHAQIRHEAIPNYSLRIAAAIGPILSGCVLQHVCEY